MPPAYRKDWMKLGEFKIKQEFVIGGAFLFVALAAAASGNAGAAAGMWEDLMSRFLMS